MYLRLFSFLMLLIILTACATPRVLLTRGVEENLVSVDQFIIIDQNEIEVGVATSKPVYPATAGETISAIIDALRYPSTVEKSRPLTRQLEGLDVRLVFLHAVNREMHGNSSLSFSISSKIINLASKQDNFNQSSSSAVMFSEFSYELSSGNLILNAFVEMYPKSRSLDPNTLYPDNRNALAKGNAVYRNTFSYRRRAVNTENIKRSLRDGAQSIARQIVQDLSQSI